MNPFMALFTMFTATSPIDTISLMIASGTAPLSLPTACEMFLLYFDTLSRYVIHFSTVAIVRMSDALGW